MPNYYDDDEAASKMDDTSSPSSAGGGDKGESMHDESSSETFLVPNSALGSDLKPGRKCVIEILRVFEDESECRYVEEEDEDEENEGEEENSGMKPAMRNAMKSMNDMASNNPGMGGY